jgi:hypothetical protein
VATERTQAADQHLAADAIAGQELYLVGEVGEQLAHAEPAVLCECLWPEIQVNWEP